MPSTWRSWADDEVVSLDPELSAERVLSRPQAVLFFLGLAITAWLVATDARLALVALLVGSAVLCTLLSLHQLRVFIIGIRAPIPPGVRSPLAEDELPRYTILVPLYREAVEVGPLVRSLDGLDYPKRLLDIKLIVPGDDLETLEALEGVSLGPHFELLLEPRGGPETKPQACNFGLQRACGELVTVFDAEDRPEPDQLRKAASALCTAAPDVACVQARLACWNPTTNLLTRYIVARQCAGYDVRRRALERIRAPILLGGTSNHFPVAVLRHLGGWDPFNVTEDADLGVRLARARYRTVMLDSITTGEANRRLGIWIRQQSRWIKGFCQTWLVHTRHPVRLVRELGLGATADFQLTILAAIVPVLLGPLRLAATLAWILVTLGALPPLHPAWVLAAAAGSFVFSTTVDVWSYAVALRRRGYRALVPFSVLFPGCELIRGIAAIRAVAQLALRPSYWEKTIHGLEARPEPAGIYEPAPSETTD